MGAQHPDAHGARGGGGRGGAADPRAAAAGGLRRRPRSSRRRAVRQLAPRRGGVQQARLEDGAGRLRGLRRPLHARQTLPPRLPRRRRRGHRLRRDPQARRQWQGGVGVRHRRDLALQPPILRRARLRYGAVQRDELQRVRAGRERGGAAGDAAAVQEAPLAGHQAGVPDGAEREPEGHHRRQPPPPGLLRLAAAAAQAPGVQGHRHRLQVRRAPEAGGRRIRHRRQHRRPVERHPRRAGGRAHLQAARPHVLHRLISW